MSDPTQAPSKKLSRIEPYRSKDGVRAHVFPSRLGGDDIVIIEADTAAGENAEVVLNVAEVASLRDWLSKASPASSDEPETAPHSGDHLQRFTAWLAKEMPSGTEIADPYWWAPKILAAACVTADEMPSQPPRAIPFAGVVQGVNYEALANATNPPEPEIVPGEFDLAFEIMRLMDNKELDTLQSCHFGYVLRVTREGATQPPGALHSYTQPAVIQQVWMENGTAIVLGIPAHFGELPEDHEWQHNCDAMGCGQCHVLARIPALTKISEQP